jgi:hypothetical protein
VCLTSCAGLLRQAEVNEHRHDYQGIAVLFSAGGRRVSPPRVHSDSRPHTASYLVRTRKKRPGREADQSPQSSDEVKGGCSCTPPSTMTVLTAAQYKQNCKIIKTDLTTQKLNAANKCRLQNSSHFSVSTRS